MTTFQSNEILRTEGIAKSYEGNIIIDNICISLRRGELVSLLGVSGSGKTTLFNVISGIETPDSGKVLLDGADVTGKPGQISYMLQKDLLLEHKKVIDNVSLPLVLKGMNKKEAREQAEVNLKEFGLEETRDKYPCQLSGGMRQRAALLRTYLASSGVALLDEPFSALDALTKTSMHQWYLKVMEKINLSTLFITHDIDEAIILSDRIYIMSGKPGQIVTEIPVAVPRENREGFNLTEEFLAVKRRVLAELG